MGEKGNALDSASVVSSPAGVAATAAGGPGVGATVIDGATNAVAKTGDEIRGAVAGAVTDHAIDSTRERLRRDKDKDAGETEEPPA